MLALDTAVVVDALLPSQPSHVPCSDLFRTLAMHETTIVFSRLLEMELCDVLFKIAVEERHGRGAREKARADGRVRRRAGRLLEEGRQSWHEILDSVPWVRVEVDEVSEEVPALMRRHGLRSYDAVHLATASLLDVSDIATFDYAFAGLPQSVATIQTTESRVGRMRARRS